jgi:hypothetical protein
MYTKIKTFEDACVKENLDPNTVIPDFSLFPEKDRQAMIDHAKLIIINKAINEDWIPDWLNYNQTKYYPWFEMGSSSGVGFSCDDYVDWSTSSNVGSRLCFESREKAIYAGKTFIELYKSYFVKE